MMFGGGVCESVGIGICVDIDTSVISNHSIMAALYWHRYQIVMTDGFHVITGALDYIGMSVAERHLANAAPPTIADQLALIPSVTPSTNEQQHPREFGGAVVDVLVLYSWATHIPTTRTTRREEKCENLDRTICLLLDSIPP